MYDSDEKMEKLSSTLVKYYTKWTWETATTATTKTMATATDDNDEHEMKKNENDELNFFDSPYQREWRIQASIRYTESVILMPLGRILSGCEWFTWDKAHQTFDRKRPTIDIGSGGGMVFTASNSSA